MTDAELETRIENARIAMMEAQDQSARRDWYEEMRSLIAQRSPQQIARMESRIEGLCR